MLSSKCTRFHQSWEIDVASITSKWSFVLNFLCSAVGAEFCILIRWEILFLLLHFQWTPLYAWFGRFPGLSAGLHPCPCFTKENTNKSFIWLPLKSMRVFPLTSVVVGVSLSSFLPRSWLIWVPFCSSCPGPCPHHVWVLGSVVDYSVLFWYSSFLLFDEARE